MLWMYYQGAAVYECNYPSAFWGCPIPALLLIYCAVHASLSVSCKLSLTSPICDIFLLPL